MYTPTASALHIRCVYTLAHTQAQPLAVCCWHARVCAILKWLAKMATTIKPAAAVIVVAAAVIAVFVVVICFLLFARRFSSVFFLLFLNFFLAFSAASTNWSRSRRATKTRINNWLAKKIKYRTASSRNQKSQWNYILSRIVYHMISCKTISVYPWMVLYEALSSHYLCAAQDPTTLISTMTQPQFQNFAICDSICFCCRFGFGFQRKLS